MGLEVRGITKKFGEKTAVDHLSFEMKEPGVFGLLGTNGAGKTTTIRNILGIMKPDEGEALWNGTPISRETLSFGYLPEERGIYMKTKVLEQLVYFGRLRGMKKEKAKKSALELMERLRVSEYQNTPAEKLSKGNQQKVQLIAAIIYNPKLIFLDEPFSALDYQTRLSVCDDISAIIRDTQKTALLITHDLSEAISMADRILVLSRRPGKVKAVFPISFPEKYDTPLKRRNAPEFSGYIHQVWKELIS